jgi:hypothetical protein
MMTNFHGDEAKKIKMANSANSQNVLLKVSGIGPLVSMYNKFM